jgi:tetratricopeptide (TPR) repeat protein
MSPDEQLQAGQPSPELRPPGAHPESAAGKTAGHGLIWGALAVVVVLVLVVLLVLPKMVSGTADRKSAEVSEPVSTQPAESAQASGQESANSRAEAEQGLQDFLHTRARLELANAPVWGEPQWSQAVIGAAEANDLFAQRKFSMANEGFAESLALLHTLESEMGERLAQALDAGWQALQTDDSESAITFFETAIAIEEDNESALEGLERARVRPALLQLMENGELARANNDLQSAQMAFLEAVELDRAYEPASIALLETTEQITELAFADAMSRALGAMNARQVAVAERALREAASLKPGEQVVLDAQYQLTQLKQKLWLASQRQKGFTDEQNENWSGAVAVYREVLARVPQAAFAREGLARAQDRERLHQQLDHYLADPTRVWSEKPRENAEKLLAAAGKPPAGETRLAEKTERLQTMIVEAQTPQTVTLQSDGLTHVSIYHVGRLGQFTTQQLELSPGTYTVVGSRPGYRDVRQTLTVIPGSRQMTVDIRCEESV